jgi:hypothetical protein
MTLLKNVDTRFYCYHHTIAILVPLKLFARRLTEGIATAVLVKMGLDLKL